MERLPVADWMNSGSASSNSLAPMLAFASGSVGGVCGRLHRARVGGVLSHRADLLFSGRAAGLLAFAGEPGGMTIPGDSLEIWVGAVG